MSKCMISRGLLMASVLNLSALSAGALAVEDSTPGFAYLGLGGQYYSSELLDDGYGGQLVLGRQFDYHAIEGGGIYSSQSKGEMLGGQIQLLVYPFGGAGGLFLGLGVGASEIDGDADVPHFSVTQGRIGLGYQLGRSSGTDLRMGLRLQASYVYAEREAKVDASQEDLPIARYFGDGEVSLMLILPFGKGSAPISNPPVEVVPVQNSADSESQQ